MVYITALLGIHHCVGCQIYRAENRGFNWDINGNHIPDVSSLDFLFNHAWIYSIYAVETEAKEEDSDC